MKKESLIELSIILGCAVLIAMGDAVYRHFGKGIPIFVAFHQEVVETGTLWLAIAIVSVLLIVAGRIWVKFSRRK